MVEALPVRRRASSGAIFFTILLDLVGFGIVIPFLAEEARDNFHTTAFVGTLLGSIYSLMQFLFVPVWGTLSDRIGRRPVLIWSVGASSVSMAGLGIGLAYGGHVGWLFLARAVSGIATANLGTASAYIADITAPEHRARGMGLIGAAFGLGFIIGPGIGGLLATIEVGGRHGPMACFAAAALGLVNFVWVFFGVGESLPENRRKTAERRRVLNTDALREAFRAPGIGRAIAVNFVMILSFTNLDQTFRYFNKDAFGMDQKATGMLFAAIGITAAAVQGGVIRPLSGKIADTALLKTGLVVQTLAFVTLAIAPGVGIWALYVGSMVLAVGNGLSQPTISAFISKRAGVDRQGAMLGSNQSMSALARVFGPALGGWLYGQFGVTSPYSVAAVGMAVCAAIALGLPKGHPAHASAST